MKTMKKLGTILGLLATAGTTPVPLAEATVAPTDNVRQDDKQSVPVAPVQQAQAPMAVRGKDRTEVVSDGLYSPGFGAPAIAYRMAARAGWGTRKRATKVRTHKSRCC